MGIKARLIYQNYHIWFRLYDTSYKNKDDTIETILEIQAVHAFPTQFYN